MHSVADELLIHPIEVVFRFTSDEVNWLYNRGGQRRFDKGQRKRMLFALGFGTAAVVLTCYMVLLITLGSPASTWAMFLPAIGIAGFRFYTACKAHRSWQQSRRRAYDSTQDLVFRASREGFSMRVPGVRETSVNWTALDVVQNEPPMLVLTAHKHSYFVPQRSFSSEQNDRLRRFLLEREALL